MSYSASEYHGSDIVTCPGCNAEKNGDYKLRTCSEGGCANKGCGECMKACSAGTHEGAYCPDHIYKVELAPGVDVGSCGECKAYMEDELAAIEVGAAMMACSDLMSEEFVRSAAGEDA